MPRDPESYWEQVAALRQARRADQFNLLALFVVVAYVIGSALVLLSLWIGLIWLAAVIAELGQVLR